jgi:DNA ligase-1
MAGIDDWLFEACYQAVGDLAETIAHVLPPPARRSDDGLAHWVEQRLLPLRGLPPDEQAAAAPGLGRAGHAERFLLVKLIGGGFRVGVSKLLVQRALAEHAGLDAKRVAQRLMGWTDARASVSAERLAAPEQPDGDRPGRSTPASPTPSSWRMRCRPTAGHAGPGRRLAGGVEVRRHPRAAGAAGRRCWIWSRGEELMTERFPEVTRRPRRCPTARCSTASCWSGARATRDASPAPFNLLQQRIGRKTLTPPAGRCAGGLRRLRPAGAEGQDLRDLPQHERRRGCSRCWRHPALRLSPLRAARLATLAAQRASVAQPRGRGPDAQAARARYGSGRTKADGTWWKWKVDPLSADGVLIYAQAGHGRRAGVYTDYTFAVWSRPPRDAAEAQAVVDAIAARARPSPARCSWCPSPRPIRA